MYIYKIFIYVVYIYFYNVANISFDFDDFFVWRLKIVRSTRKLAIFPTIHGGFFSFFCLNLEGKGKKKQ